MPANIEIKGKVRDPDNLLKVAEQLSGTAGEVIYQEDTFYNVPTGRLKLRRLTVRVIFDKPHFFLYHRVIHNELF